MNKANATFLIVTADDFGSSIEVNRAVERAAREGILTCASLMISGSAACDAVRRARRIPTLEIALHVTLTEGRPLSPARLVPNLVARDGHFKDSLTQLGLALQFSKAIQRQAQMEVAAQFKAFEETRLGFGHVDCHHHFHVHPRLFDIILQNALGHGLRTIRIPYEPWEISGTICKGNSVRNRFYRMVFTRLSARCRDKIHLHGMISSDGVFGLYQTGELTEEWVANLLDRLKHRPGFFELYSHPSSETGSPGHRELKALLSPGVRETIKKNGIRLMRHMDMVRSTPMPLSGI
ncbi:MAG: hopanoid biosynthesis-associated protein HpnK [Desulfobacteraceae bacterium]|nr:hopanoid biosynthesis-associated protein HpnK [Desulfobacteraceae bacterium]